LKREERKRNVGIEGEERGEGKSGKGRGTKW
jgi:hypothetical protein